MGLVWVKTNLPAAERGQRALVLGPGVGEAQMLGKESLICSCAGLSLTLGLLENTPVAFFNKLLCQSSPRIDMNN